MTEDNFNWWKEGIIYQIYPRSFYDSNGDGIGDIPGITEKLDYLQDLGIDAVWLSPINTSPMFDFGYDVSDYRAIDPVFGTMKDMDRFIAEAHRKNIRVVMDLVVNHSSHLHPWFLESRSSRNNPKRDWFLWHDGRNGREPNNWYGVFGGRAWEYDEKTAQYYHHSFLKEQPDFNWRNRELRKAVYGEFKFWLDKGVDGFRLDVANYYIKDELFRDNPIAPGPNPRPYDWQRHVYDRDRPETHGVFRELRELMNRYDGTMLVGEIFTHDDPVTSASYLGNGTDELHLAFDFSLIHHRRWNAGDYRGILERWYGAIPPAGWPCNVLSNHDKPRMSARVGRTRREERMKVLLALLLTGKGTPFLYYGDEIGMSRGRIPRERIQDPVGIKYWPFHKGRDPERTPMQWNGSRHGGFTAGEPWLPVNPDYTGRNAESQRADEGSMLNFVRMIIGLRKRVPALRLGEWVPVTETGDILAFIRTHDSGKAMVMLNFASAPRSFAITGDDNWAPVFSTHRSRVEVLPRGNCTLAPCEVTVCVRAGSIP